MSGKRRITADTSLRLGKLFGVEDDYFLTLQGRDDIEELRETLREELRNIRSVCATSKCPGHPKDPYEYDTKDKAIKAWNRRADDGR